MEHAIIFAEWIRVNGWKPDTYKVWSRQITGKPLQVKNTNELYRMFMTQNSNLDGFVEYTPNSLPNGIYEVKTNLDRVLKCEMFNGWWMENEKDALENEKITHVKL